MLEGWDWGRICWEFVGSGEVGGGGLVGGWR